MKTIITLALLFLTTLNSSYLRQFECNSLYILTDDETTLKEFDAFKIPKGSLDIELKNYAYNVLDNFIYAMVVDPLNLKGWSRYDIVKLDRDGKVINLGTPIFKKGDNIYDAFRVGNGVIDTYGYYYSLGDPISIEPKHLKRAILYIVYLGNNPKAGSLRFDKKELKILNFYEWEAPNAIAYLDSTQKIYAINNKKFFEVDIKKFTIKELELSSSITSDMRKIWTEDNRVFIYSDSGDIYEAEIANDRVTLKKIKKVKSQKEIELTSCISPTLNIVASKGSIKLGESFFYNVEIKNPLSYPIKVEFVDRLSDGASFENFSNPNIKSSNFYFSPEEIRIDDLLIPKLSTLKFKLKVSVEENSIKNISNQSYIIFRGIKIFPKSSQNSNIVLDTPSIKLKERLITSKDEDSSGDISAGDRLIFELNAINIGKVNLYDVRVGDPILTPDSKFCQLLKPNESCTLRGVYIVKKSDEKRGKILTYANVSAKNLPKKSLNLSIPVAADAVDLSININSNKKLRVDEELNSTITIKNLSKEMATNVQVTLKAPNELIIEPKSSWSFPFIDAKSSLNIHFKIKSKTTREYKLIAEVTSEDKDIDTSNNRVEFRVKVFKEITPTPSKRVVHKSKRVKLESSIEKKVTQNHPPIAKDDEIIIPMNRKIVVDISKGVLVNDRDLDGDSLKVISFKLDSNGDGVNELYHPKDLVSIYGVGEFRLFDDGGFEFELQDGYNGYIPTVTYSVSDNNGGVSSAKLIISVGDNLSIKREKSLSEEIPPQAINQIDNQDGSIFFILYLFVTFAISRRRFAIK